MKVMPAMIGIPSVLITVLAPMEVDRLSLSGGVLALVFFTMWTSRYRRVDLDGDELLIANRSGDLRVPLSQVSAVRCTRWMNTKDITIVFDRDIGIGSEVRFMPRAVLGIASFAEHPLALELRQLAGLS